MPLGCGQEVDDASLRIAQVRVRRLHPRLHGNGPVFERCGKFRRFHAREGRAVFRDERAVYQRIDAPEPFHDLRERLCRGLLVGMLDFERQHLYAKLVLELFRGRELALARASHGQVRTMARQGPGNAVADASGLAAARDDDYLAFELSHRAPRSQSW